MPMFGIFYMAERLVPVPGNEFTNKEGQTL